MGCNLGSQGRPGAPTVADGVSPALPWARCPHCKQSGWLLCCKQTHGLRGVIPCTVVYTGECSKMVSTGFSFPVTHVPWTKHAMESRRFPVACW